LRACRCPTILERHNSLRRLFLITDGEYPALSTLLITRIACIRWVAVPLSTLLLFACIDQIAHINGIIVAHYDILTTRADSIAGGNGDLALAWATNDL
jgi:hypothetical protein